MQRYSLQELKQQSSTGFRVLERWLKNLETDEDPEIKVLLERFLKQDKLNAEEQVMRLRPLEDLLEHLLFRAAKQIFDTCSAHSSDAVTAIVTARDQRQRTILHIAAEQGNTKLAELYLLSVAEESRSFFAEAVDQGGEPQRCLFG